MRVSEPPLPRVRRVDTGGVDVETERGLVRVHRNGRVEAPDFLDREAVFAALAQELIFGFFGDAEREEVTMAKKPMSGGSCKGGACPPKGGGKKGGKKKPC